VPGATRVRSGRSATRNREYATVSRRMLAGLTPPGIFRSGARRFSLIFRPVLDNDLEVSCAIA